MALVLKNAQAQTLFVAVQTKVGVADKWATLPDRIQALIFEQFVSAQFADSNTAAAFLTLLQGVL